MNKRDKEALQEKEKHLIQTQTQETIISLYIPQLSIFFSAVPEVRDAEYETAARIGKGEQIVRKWMIQLEHQCH